MPISRPKSSLPPTATRPNNLPTHQTYQKPWALKCPEVLRERINTSHPKMRLGNAATKNTRQKARTSSTEIMSDVDARAEPRSVKRDDAKRRRESQEPVEELNAQGTKVPKNNACTKPLANNACTKPLANKLSKTVGQQAGKAVGQQAVQNLSANELSRTHRPTSCLKPTPDCLQRHRGQSTISELTPSTPPSNHLAPAKFDFNWGFKIHRQDPVSKPNLHGMIPSP